MTVVPAPVPNERTAQQSTTFDWKAAKQRAKRAEVQGRSRCEAAPVKNKATHSSGINTGLLNPSIRHSFRSFWEGGVENVFSTSATEKAGKIQRL